MKKIISGKVREVYEIDERRLVIVATDRISAFDVILKPAIPNKGIALTLISNFWFAFTGGIIQNHLLSAGLSELPAPFCRDPAQYDKRTILVKKLNMLPYEFIVRGYLFGSMWEAYQASGSFCGREEKGGLALAQKLAEPVITPAAKSAGGHDVYISAEQLSRELGAQETGRIFRLCLKLYEACSEYALKKGILIADTKFEFGYDENGALTLGDEIFTPDSSRFWSADAYQTGVSPKSLDKQFVRDWLIERRLNGVTPGPELPEEVVRKTAGLYQECCKRITGQDAC